MASGRPSSRMQISAALRALDSSNISCGRTAWARCANRATAGAPHRSARALVGRVAGGGRGSRLPRGCAPRGWCRAVPRCFRGGGSRRAAPVRLSACARRPVLSGVSRWPPGAWSGRSRAPRARRRARWVARGAVPARRGRRRPPGGAPPGGVLPAPRCPWRAAASVARRSLVAARPRGRRGWAAPPWRLGVARCRRARRSCPGARAQRRPTPA